jgi:hypothetical protein
MDLDGDILDKIKKYFQKQFIMINGNRLSYYSFEKEEILYKLLEARLSKDGRKCDNCKEKIKDGPTVSCKKCDTLICGDCYDMKRTTCIICKK